ncbi:MAG: hypothetical protein P8O12_06670 [Tateyamaria sp.]|nr:hypothetical protein [Tateyamaria sp.]
MSCSVNSIQIHKKLRYDLVASPEDKYNTIIRVAASESGEVELAQWIKENLTTLQHLAFDANASLKSLFMLCKAFLCSILGKLLRALIIFIPLNPFRTKTPANVYPTFKNNLRFNLSALISMNITSIQKGTSQ